MADWLLAKDQKHHCCPTCCLGFKTEPELFVHLKHIAVHQVRGTSCNTSGGSHIWCQDTLLHKLLTADKPTYSCSLPARLLSKALRAVMLACILLLSLHLHQLVSAAVTYVTSGRELVIMHVIHHV